MPQRCEATTMTGERCRGVAVAGGATCSLHTPALAARVQQGRVQGGRARSRPTAVLPADTPPLPLDSVADVKTLLAATVNDVRTGRLDVRIGNCLGVLAGVLLRAIEGGDLEKRLESLETELRDRAGGRHGAVA